MTMLLEKAIAGHFRNPRATLRKFESNLREAALDFDVTQNLREFPFPPQAGSPNGLPSFFFYFLPGTRHTPDAGAEIRRGTGIGLSCGCVIRLIKALNVLFDCLTERERALY